MMLILFYKDVYLEALRDEWHFKIIANNKANISKMYVYELEYLINNSANRIKKYMYSPFLLETAQLEDKETTKSFKLSSQAYLPVIKK